jgi:hypothetical protein
MDSGSPVCSDFVCTGVRGQGSVLSPHEQLRFSRMNLNDTYSVLTPMV